MIMIIHNIFYDDDDLFPCALKLKFYKVQLKVMKKVVSDFIINEYNTMYNDHRITNLNSFKYI